MRPFRLKTILLIVSLFSITLYGNETFKDYNTLSHSRVELEDGYHYLWEFGQSTHLLISKKEFGDISEAKSFCRDHLYELTNHLSILPIIMGLSPSYPEIGEWSLKKLNEKTTGILTWFDNADLVAEVSDYSLSEEKMKLIESTDLFVVFDGCGRYGAAIDGLKLNKMDLTHVTASDFMDYNDLSQFPIRTDEKSNKIKSRASVLKKTPLNIRKSPIKVII